MTHAGGVVTTALPPCAKLAVGIVGSTLWIGAVSPTGSDTDTRTVTIGSSAVIVCGYARAVTLSRALSKIWMRKSSVSATTRRPNWSMTIAVGSWSTPIGPGGFGTGKATMPPSGWLAEPMCAVIGASDAAGFSASYFANTEILLFEVSVTNSRPVASSVTDQGADRPCEIVCSGTPEGSKTWMEIRFGRSEEHTSELQSLR